MSRSHPRPRRPGAIGQLRELLRLISAATPAARYEIRFAAGPREPVIAFDEQAALDTACRLSRDGEQVDVYLTGSRGACSLAGSFRAGQPADCTTGEDPAAEDPETTAAEGVVVLRMTLRPPRAQAAPWAAACPPGPWDDIPGQRFPGQRFPSPVPGPASTSVLPPVRPVPSGQWPDLIYPLPVSAISGGRHRPLRLLYGNDMTVVCRPVGGSPVWVGLAAGAIPANGGLERGWLQVVRAGEGDLRVVHPALLAPWAVDPYVYLPYRQRRRWVLFDGAEAAGLDAASIQAPLIDSGDRIRIFPADGPPRVCEVLDRLYTGGPAVLLVLATPSAGFAELVVPDSDHVNVLLPPRHPAETCPVAARLFAGPPASEDQPAVPAAAPYPRSPADG